MSFIIQVGDEYIHVVVAARALKHAGHVHLKTFDHAKHCETLTVSVKQAVDFQKAIDSWKMPNYVDHHFQEWYEIEEAMKASDAKLRRYMVSFDEWDSDQKAQSNSLLSKFRGRRDTMSLKFRAAGVPTVLAKAIADHECNLLEASPRPSTSPEPLETLPNGSEQEAVLLHKPVLLSTTSEKQTCGRRR